MNFIEIVLIGIGLGMDAMSVSICKGLAMHKMNWKKATIIGLYFGIFQALMPILGFILGTNFKDIIESISYWISFGLLELVGINMILESRKKDDEKIKDDVKLKEMITLAIATSIDALAVGISFAILKVSIINTTTVIGVITLIMSIAGVKIGNSLGKKLTFKAEVLGGIILISIGIKMLISGL